MTRDNRAIDERPAEGTLAEQWSNAQEQSATDPASIFMQGISFQQMEKIDQAAECYREVLRQDPSHIHALHLLGTLEMQAGNVEQGVELIHASTLAGPHQSMAHFNLANGYCKLGRIDEALQSYDRLLVLDPDNIDGLLNRAFALVRVKRYEEALSSYDRVLHMHPTFAQVIANRGNVLRAMKRYDDALFSYDHSLTLEPNLAEVYSNRGAVLQNLNRHEEALHSYDKALQLCPGLLEALTNRGSALRSLYRHDEALDNYRLALQRAPNNIELLMNRGNVLRELNRYQEALVCFRRIQAIDAQQAQGHLGEFNCLILQNELQQAWQKYEWRPTGKRDFTEPLWLGKEPLNGKTILLHAEQGYGDMLHFCRYATLVADLGATVVLEVPQPLHRLMQSLHGVNQIVARGEPLPLFDYHCPLMSLPLAFNTSLDTIPARIPYLHCDESDRDSWARKLGEKAVPRIGLVWSGNPEHDNDVNRSIALREFVELTKCDAQFVSLQREIREIDRPVLQQHGKILDFHKNLHDFCDTAGLLANMDLVISVDTSIAHLAGAMGKPVWILLPFNAEWRWLHEREDSPWYRTARLFRQKSPCDWKPVFSAIANALSLL